MIRWGQIWTFDLETRQTLHHPFTHTLNSFIRDPHFFIFEEPFGLGIIRVEIILREIAQKAIYFQVCKVTVFTIPLSRS